MMPRRSGVRGQSLVEFALILPVFLLMLFGLIDGARYVFMNNALSNAAREGARVAAAEARHIGTTTVADPSCVASESLITSANPGAHVCPADFAALKAHVTAAANRMVAPFGAVSSVDLRCEPITTAPAANWTEPGTPCPAANRTQTKNAVWIRVNLNFQPITPLLAAWSTGTSGSATMTIN